MRRRRLRRKRKASKREAIRRRKALKRGEKALKYGREAFRRERKGRTRSARAASAGGVEELTQELREITGSCKPHVQPCPTATCSARRWRRPGSAAQGLPAGAADGMAAHGRSRREAGRYPGAAE